MPATVPERTNSPGLARYRLLLAGLAGFLILAMALSLGMGRLDITLSEVMAAANAAITGDMSRIPPNSLAFLLIRLPRCLLALAVGMGISTAGAVYQSVFRNPLVSPDILAWPPAAPSGRPWVSFSRMSASPEYACWPSSGASWPCFPP